MALAKCKSCGKRAMLNKAGLCPACAKGKK
jgi:ribosomal protein L37E